MSDKEFQVLDELYFIQSFQELLVLTDLNEDELKTILEDMLAKGWVKSMKSREGEEPASEEDYLTHYASYHYLATKAGLLAHNSR